MNRCRKYKSDKIINNILENHFEEFRKLKWHRVRREMRELLKDLQDAAYGVDEITSSKIRGKSNFINR
ncbi:MAG: hypothetical protein RSD47_04820 [Romboutsia sp.]